MGTVTFSDAGDMGSPTIWYGSVSYADDNEIWLYNGTYGAIYTGYNFTYSNGALVGGTLTGYIQARNISTDYYGNITGYTVMYRGEGFSIPAATAYYYIQTAKDAWSFMEYAMSGGDTMILPPVSGSHNAMHNCVCGRISDEKDKGAVYAGI